MKKRCYSQWVVIILVGVFFIFIFPRVWWWSERHYERQTEYYHRRLLDILNNEDKELERHDALQELAREVGAGFERTYIVGYYKIDEHTTTIPHNRISESELVQNIQSALQTRTMIVASRAAGKSYVVAFAAVVVSVFAAAAAWRAAENAKREVVHLKEAGEEIAGADVTTPPSDAPAQDKMDTVSEPSQEDQPAE